jgi:hypothetical protein
MPPGRPDRRVIALGVGIPLAIVVGVVLAGVLGGGSGSEPETTSTTPTTSPAVDARWDRALAAAFEPLVEALPEYARAVDAWAEGERSDDELAGVLDQVGPVVDGVAEAARALPAHRRDRLAQPLVADAASLYVQAVAAHREALAAADPATAEQWDRLGRRLRILGDRAFDRARERTAPPLEDSEGIELHLPAEVPDFDRLELAVGPPLEPADAEVDALPRERAPSRASQPEADWLESVRALDVPSADDVEAAEGNAGTLAGLARQLVAAAEALRDEPVPEGDRGRADRVAVAWLVLADAARAAQLAALSGTPSPVPAALVAIASGDGLGAP